jgi:hypothetical protein
MCARAMCGCELMQLREVLIRHTPRPEEVLIEADESGDIVRTTTKDTDIIAMYKTMKDTLVYLTHLDCADTERLMLEKLNKQVEGSEWGWDALNTLCWAIGAISGTMTEEVRLRPRCWVCVCVCVACAPYLLLGWHFSQRARVCMCVCMCVVSHRPMCARAQDEKRFLVGVIKDLLGLCEAKRGKNNKVCVKPARGEGDGNPTRNACCGCDKPRRPNTQTCVKCQCCLAFRCVVLPLCRGD